MRIISFARFFQTSVNYSLNKVEVEGAGAGAGAGHSKQL